MEKMVIPLVIGESVICTVLIAILIQMKRNEKDNDNMIHHVDSDISETDHSNKCGRKDSHDSVKKTTKIPSTETCRIGLVSTVATRDELDGVIESILMMDKRIQTLESRFDNLCKTVWYD